jgi:hypothetical protein
MIFAQHEFYFWTDFAETWKLSLVRTFIEDKLFTDLIQLVVCTHESKMMLTVYFLCIACLNTNDCAEKENSMIDPFDMSRIHQDIMK